MPRVYRTLTLDDYEVTKKGEVINKHTGRQPKFQYNTKGYPRVIIGGKKYFVHRLVAEKYIPNPENKPQVNHIDGNKENNCVENLEWVTSKENRKHAIITGLQWSKLTVDEVRFIKHHKDDMTTRQLADKFNVTRHCIYKITHGINFKSIE